MANQMAYNNLNLNIYIDLDLKHFKRGALRAAPLAKEIGAKGLNPDSRLAFAIVFLFLSIT